MNILDAITEHKRIEILKRKKKRPLSDLSSCRHYSRRANRIDTGGLDRRPGIIAEFKKRSPSRGPIHPDADPVRVAEGYAAAGVSAMSILTDRNFFGGSFMDLMGVRDACPELVLLRKDFIIDPYQLHESSAYGADVVLLIAAILEKRAVEELVLEARSLGMSVLLEVHTESELEKYHPAVEMVGVNNRDLRTFRVDTEWSLKLIGQLPPGVLPVSESGFSSQDEIWRLHRAGFRLFLMGETFMKHQDPGLACREFMEEWKVE